MRLLYLLMRFYPYWSLPSLLLCVEIGWVFHRKGKTALQILLWIFAAMQLIGVVAWFLYRGDLHSNAWVDYLFG